MAEASKLKVSIWCPFVPGTALMATAEKSVAEQYSALARELGMESSGLQKEIFGWRIFEDPFGGVVGDDDRQKLRAILLDALSVSIGPKNRSIAILRVFLKEANDIIEANRVEWTGSQSPSIEDDEERRVNPLLALVNHLSWLADIFEEYPNISVTVR